MITNERLAELQREAELGTLTTGGGRGISGKEVIELINAYRALAVDYTPNAIVERIAIQRNLALVGLGLPLNATPKQIQDALKTKPCLSG